MPPKNPGISKKRATPRRKIALACEPCREKKVRCDGEKPICGPCMRRSYTIAQCIYSTDNSRTASQDDYIRVLHARIQELEEACLKAGVSALGMNSRESDGPERSSERSLPEDQDSPPSQSPSRGGIEEPAPSRGGPQGIADALLSPGQQPQTEIGTSCGNRTLLAAETASDTLHPSPAASSRSPHFDSPGHVTGMGQLSALEDQRRTPTATLKEYYGTSSTASLMRFARASMPFRSTSRNSGDPSPPNQSVVHYQAYDPSAQFRLEDFTLPPRSLADHLLECFWNHVYCLYPFVHRPSFEIAYENLWKSDREPKTRLPDANIGLGGQLDSGPKSMVFHCALNCMFAIGCHFANIPLEEREATAHTFFLRCKRFVGPEILEIGTIGVVQTFLITALYLQSSPFPSRCWNSIGVACRVAQGLGLHETHSPYPMAPHELEIRRRTWHGCVILDIVVSMTYGRPSMTSHIAPVALPSVSAQENEAPSLMIFYVATIELYKILDDILSDVYNAWRSHSSKRGAASSRPGGSNMDLLIELERRLCSYEANLPSFLNWTLPQPAEFPADQIAILQRNVLRGRYNYLRLLLYRPIFTQLCSDNREGRAQSTDIPHGKSTESVLYSCMADKCAAACVMTAIDLIQFVFETYRTSTTDAWWYNSFYTSTAAIVLIMSHSVPSILDSIGPALVQESWRRCEQIFGHMATFSHFARNTLRFLQAAYYSQAPPPEAAATNFIASSPTPHLPPGFGGLTAHYPGLDEFTAGLGSGSVPDEFGFLSWMDIPDFSSWLGEMRMD